MTVAHRAGGMVVVVLVVLASARTAGATSCISHVYERMQVKLDAVFRGDAKVARPPELEDLDEVLGSGPRGASILFWHASTMGFAKFYALATPSRASPEVQAHLDSAGRRSFETACGYAVPFIAIRPGEYRFAEEHTDGAKVSVGIDRPVLVVAPGRDHLELRFDIGGVAYRARYRVACTHFVTEPASCAPITGAAEPAPMPAPSTSTPGCRGCTSGGDAGLLGVLALVLTRRRRGT